MRDMAGSLHMHMSEQEIRDSRRLSNGRSLGMWEEAARQHDAGRQARDESMIYPGGSRL